MWPHVATCGSNTAQARVHDPPTGSQALSEPLPFDRRGEHGPDEKPYLLVPVFSWHEVSAAARAPAWGW